MSVSKDDTLPTGWTRHLAPSGHFYYYHAESKRSTYERPKSDSQVIASVKNNNSSESTSRIPTGPRTENQNHERTEKPKQSNQKRKRKKDLRSIDPPQVKVAVKDCDPWLIVILKSGRWFVYNPQTNKSFWDVPEDVLRKIEEMDRDDLILLVARARGLTLSTDSAAPKFEEQGRLEAGTEEGNANSAPDNTVIEDVSDDEGVESDRENDDDNIDLNDENSLEEMSNDDDGLGTGFELDWDNIEDDLKNDDSTGNADLTNQERLSIFYSLLEDFSINPFGVWEVELNKVLDDDRYDILESNSARSDAFDKWAALKIREQKLQHEELSTKTQDSTEDIIKKMVEDSPVGRFLSLVRRKYKEKYFYVDFKRKYRNEALFDIPELTDKDKEKIYREYASYKKKPQNDQITLVKEFLSSKIKHSSDLSKLTDTLFNDVRFYIVPDDQISKLVDETLLKLQTQKTSSSDRSIQDRQNKILAEKAKQQRQLSYERRKLEEEVEKLDEAKYSLKRNLSTVLGGK
ncbi:DNA replication protein Dre4 [Sugiyamaella lignohabitans]|uniref:DNA replication protein Dre4 n=1 Tax=Sugiyamaella lignohabitans TaxID=796027 RepID=A0A167ES23_9ASCO|nr:DNA replication protein Dre4 [Sugiyamaella lignohabitans]ANB14401.1 DNA replication protein Dre4 [Sugiyamaella lignohabitans]